MPSRSFLFTCFLFCLACFTSSSFGQSVSENQQSRYNFAEMYIGMDLLGTPSAGETFYRPNTNTDVRSYPIGSRIHPRILIGGTHFWGHADFFVNLPITAFRQSQELETRYSPGVETGGLIYPWRLQENALSPYVGASWSMINYRQAVSGDRRGPDLHRSRVFLKGGLGWQNKMGLWELGVSWLPNRSFRYPLSRYRFETVTLPSWSFRLSYKYLFDTTDIYEGEATRGRIPSRIKGYRDTGKLNTFSLA